MKQITQLTWRSFIVYLDAHLNLLSKISLMFFSLHNRSINKNDKVHRLVGKKTPQNGRNTKAQVNPIICTLRKYTKLNGKKKTAHFVDQPTLWLINFQQHETQLKGLNRIHKFTIFMKILISLATPESDVYI